MSDEKPSLYNAFSECGDIRYIIQLLEQYSYNEEDASEVINCYEPDENGQIPEVEHIEVLVQYFPKSYVSSETMSAIRLNFPNMVECITNLMKK